MNSGPPCPDSVPVPRRKGRMRFQRVPHASQSPSYIESHNETFVHLFFFNDLFCRGEHTPNGQAGALLRKHDRYRSVTTEMKHLLIALLFFMSCLSVSPQPGSTNLPNSDSFEGNSGATVRQRVVINQ
jgi:hypothetical protein